MVCAMPHIITVMCEISEVVSVGILTGHGSVGIMHNEESYLLIDRVCLDLLKENGLR